MITGVDFVTVPTSDLDAAVEFFGTTLGLRRSAYLPERNFAEFETGNLTLSVINPVKMGMEHHKSPNPIALHVDDMEAARARSRRPGSSSSERPSTPASVTCRSSPIPTATR